MNDEAEKVLAECDITLLLLDGSTLPNQEDVLLANILKNTKRPDRVLMVINKIDLLDPDSLLRNAAEYRSLIPASSAISISATRGDNLDRLVNEIIALLPQGASFFPEDQLTDLYERDYVADLIREAALLNLRAEVPHSLAIRIDEYKERENQMLYIGATIFVERESQKGIVIGQGGATLKKIGTAARKEIEAQLERQVFLQIRVKIRKNWRNDEEALRLFGYNQS
jgi:GTP-binding protein Era